jgi:chaperonin GroES
MTGLKHLNAKMSMEALWDAHNAALDDALGAMNELDGANPSGIQPLGYKILVLPKEVETKTKGGLLLPETKVEKEGFQRREGIIVAMSPMAFHNPDWPADAPKPQIGDRVMFARYQADEIIGRDGATYWIMNDQSVMATIED